MRPLTPLPSRGGLFVLDYGKFHPDRRAGVVLVFNFGFGERGAIVNAPVDGLQAAIDVAFLEEIEKRAGDGRFVVGIHGEIRLVPPAEDAETLEFDLVNFHVARREFAAHAAKFRRRDLAGLSAEFLFDLRLDGEAVAIPAGDVRRAEAGHGLRFHDHVFEGLVQAGAEVDFAGGIGRTVVQDE